MLDRTRSVIIGGAGPYGLTAALALTKRLGDNAPHITIIEPCDLCSSEKWEPCKGCAGGILRGTIEHMVSNYDRHHIAAFEPGGISVWTPQGKRYLSRCRVDQIAFHLPHELGIDPPIVRFSGSDVVVPTFRIEGPRHLHDDWLTYDHIGFSPFLFNILKATNPRVDLVQGRIRQIDVDGERPVVEVRHHHDEELFLEADHVLVNTGISKSRPPLIKREGAVQDLPRVKARKTLLMSTEIPRSPLTDSIFNVRRGPTTSFRAHLFITDGPAHYLLIMPKVVGTRTALTVAAFGREEGDELVPEDISRYLSSHPILKEAGIDFEAEEAYCHCGAFIPNGTLSAEEQYGPGYSIGGDLAGGLRLWKNGIGTAISEAERFVDHIVQHGYSQPVLGHYFEQSRQRVINDNEAGRRLLRWVDLMLDKPVMPQLLQIYLMAEQRLSRRYQWLLPVFGATTTGKVPYKELSHMLRRGPRGAMLSTFANLMRTPIPQP